MCVIVRVNVGVSVCGIVSVNVCLSLCVRAVGCEVVCIFFGFVPGYNVDPSIFNSVILNAKTKLFYK